jgi:hypothetical protein
LPEKEIKDGKEYTVTRLPDDWRLKKTSGRERALWQAASRTVQGRDARRAAKKKQRKQKLSKAAAKAFLATPEGQAWLERKIAEKNASRPDPGPANERLTRTQFPFTATINGKTVTVDRVDGKIVAARK